MFSVEVDLSELQGAINRLTDFGADKTPVTRGIAAVLAAGVERGFDKQSDPVTGQPWAALSPVTLARRAKAGHSGKILQVSGSLATSFDRFYTADSAGVRTSKIYATTMHFGAAQGAFGTSHKGAAQSLGMKWAKKRSAATSKKGHPIPWGTIPARPLLPVGADGAMHADDEEEIATILHNALQAVFEG